MPTGETHKSNWKERLKETFRLVIMHNDTFKEVGSYKLNLLSLYILLSSIFVTLTFLVFCIVMYTPIKRYIPGYGDYNQQVKISTLQSRIKKLEKESNAQNEYAQNIKKILTGDVEPSRSSESKEAKADISKPETVERIPEDEKLRKTLSSAIKKNGNNQAPARNFAQLDIPIENNYFISPVKGQVSSEFNPSTKHFGIDLIAPKNTPVQAVKEGYVIMADWTLETGYTIAIQHNNNLVTFYKHNSGLLKQVGNYVKTGEPIAIIGNTGTQSSGPHLHLELWHNGKPIDPNTLINFK
ncbi:MAG TPA: M23 family metallopeptidase [Saprospiraceae bacterium]|nr:M23 family metallopeptidase [Saprospiraceae bacterium]